MNSRQLQYAVVLSEVLNISAAAEKLNITQPALSKQILSLEKELGVTLFDRSTTPLGITPAGELFVREAKEILFRQDGLARSMQDFKKGKLGRLTIGISPFRASYFLSDIIAELKREFSGLQIVLNEDNSTKLLKDTIDGKVDFSILNLPVDETLLDATELSPEPIVLAVPDNFKEKIIGKTEKNADSKYPMIDIPCCENIPFIALGKTQELRILFDKICAESHFSPDISLQVVGITTAYNLACAGLGATVLPLRFVDTHDIGSKLSVFTLKNATSPRHPAIITRKGQHITRYAKRAIELIKNREVTLK